MAKLSKKKQDELIKEEIERYRKIFENLQEDKKQVVQRLIERVAFMTITLEILEDTIKTKGATYTFVNGSQRMVVENPAQKSYNTMINRYTSAYEKLFALLPKDGLNVDTSDDDDGFESFVENK
ncbi:P27 family phage terminase small subunit [Metabacillus halosaccharovorans]|uniref:P27 family phage terminase small subunit n=1 Tax=Metabacillus halosaccharovorans TaxID=930124 RepID=UPI000994B004|nr:P27 family phage terminase small subunit [Metabacillus halosaccharovorans]